MGLLGESGLGQTSQSPKHGGGLFGGVGTGGPDASKFVEERTFKKATHTNRDQQRNRCDRFPFSEDARLVRYSCVLTSRCMLPSEMEEFYDEQGKCRTDKTLVCWLFAICIGDEIVVTPNSDAIATLGCFVQPAL